MIVIILTSIFTIFALYYYYKKIYLFNKKLEVFPCPPHLPLIGHSLSLLSSDSGGLDEFLGYIRKYGDPVRIITGPGYSFLLTTNYDYFQFVLNSPDLLKKSVEYRFFENWLGKGLITSNGPKWKHRRRIITPTFHFQILDNFLEIFESKSDILIRKIEKMLDSTSVEIFSLMSLCTLDIICESAMGTPVHAQEQQDSEYVKSVKTVLEVIVRRIFSPVKNLDSLYLFTEDYKMEKAAINYMHSYTRDVIKKRVEARITEGGKPTKKKAFLDLFLDLRAQDPTLSLEDIREEVDTFIFAGHHTTATAISFILHCLANHPDAQEKALHEQREIFGDDYRRSATFDDLKKMRYLDFVIKEGLRLYPSAPVYSRELEEDTMVNGHLLPKGLTICLFSYGLHRNPIYYKDPEKFIPERFEEIDGTKPFAYLPFSAGQRNCIGKRFALAEMKLILSKMLRHFELLPSVPFHEPKLVFDTTLSAQNGVRIQFHKRK